MKIEMLMREVLSRCCLRPFACVFACIHEEERCQNTRANGLGSMATSLSFSLSQAGTNVLAAWLPVHPHEHRKRPGHSEPLQIVNASSRVETDRQLPQSRCTLLSATPTEFSRRLSTDGEARKRHRRLVAKRFKRSQYSLLSQKKTSPQRLGIFRPIGFPLHIVFRLIGSK